MPDKTRVLIIEPDKEESDRATMRIRLDHPDALVSVVPDMNAAAHALSGQEFDLVIYSPMGLSTIGGRRSPIVEVANFLSKYNTPVVAITPNSPPLYVKQAIDSVPGVEAITQKDFQQIIDKLTEIAAKKSGSGTLTRENQIEVERLKAKFEGFQGIFGEWREQVRAIASSNAAQDLALTETKNALSMVLGRQEEILKRLEAIDTRIDTVFNLVDAGERLNKIELAKLDRNKTVMAAFITAASTIVVIVISTVGAPIIPKIIDQIWPPRHEPAPAPTKLKDAKK